MRHLLIASLYTSALLISSSVHAEMDVDDADSLRFQSFHEKKDGGIKVYDSKKGGLQLGESKEAKKVYEQHAAPASANAPSTPDNSATTNSPAVLASENTHAAIQGKKAQRFEIRERYSLSRSTATPYSAFYVIEALHKQMAGICSNGWEIIREFSVPVEHDFYMHYEFECL